jgi:N-acetylmuramoyl-L-alanine amidase
MHKQLYAILLLFLLPRAIAETPSIRVVYPKKNQKIHATDKTFLFGNVHPRDASLTVNGQPVPVYSTGGFLAYLPIEQGRFRFELELQTADGTVARETLPVLIPKKRRPKTTTLPLIEKSDYLPAADLGVLLGEPVTFQCKTLPDRNVVLSLGDGDAPLPLEEHALNGVKGIYRTTRAFQNPLQEHSFRFSVPNDTEIPAFVPPVRITVLPPTEYPVLKIVEDGAKARFFPGGGYDTFLKSGTTLKSTGFTGNWYRARLSQHHEVFVEKDQVDLRPPGTPLSGASIKSIRVGENDRDIEILLFYVSPVNATWIEYPGEKKLGIKFYNSHADCDRMAFDPGVSMLKDVRWTQLEEDVVQLDFYLDFDPVFGHSIAFKPNHASISIRKDPGARPRESIRICIDPGHGGPDTGALGPLATAERDVNLLQSVRLGEILKEAGYQVFYTREDENGPGLYERAPMAVQRGADFFLSVHHNSTSDGTDPFAVRGTETYFYNRGGKELGRFIHPYLLEATGIRDGGLKFGNFAVLRNNAVPSILLEIDYLIIPEAEARILSDDFRNRVGRAVLEGLEAYRGASKSRTAPAS